MIRLDHIQGPNTVLIQKRLKAEAAARAGSQEPPASAPPRAPEHAKAEKKPRKPRKKK